MSARRLDYLSSGLYSIDEPDPDKSVFYLETRLYGRYSGPFFTVHGEDSFRWVPAPVVPVWRDANATAGTWWQVIRLEHRPVVWDGAEIYAFEPELHDMPGEYVPLFEGDVERRAWRRRKWWGRGPIRFCPYRRPRFGPMLFIPYAFRTIETVIGAAYKASLDDGSGTTKGTP